MVLVAYMTVWCRGFKKIGPVKASVRVLAVLAEGPMSSLVKESKLPFGDLTPITYAVEGQRHP